MAGRIFHLNDRGEAMPMEEQPYDAENVLQELLAKHPDLLAGDQINSAEPRRWLLVKREMGIPSREEGGDRWSVDHLFLDQDAIPTLIEVKRSTDTRLRREVVGQMLDYAANAVVYWPVEQIQAEFEKNHDDPEETLAEFLSEEVETSEFWQNAKTNLQAGRIRMVFVADLIPDELQRIVEFLNEQMDPAEVLAVEIKQFIGTGMKTLVPRVVGQTAQAETRKGAGQRSTPVAWDEESYFREAGSRWEASDLKVARCIADWMKEHCTRVDWRKGAKGSSYSGVVVKDNVAYDTFKVTMDGAVRIFLRGLGRKPAFSDPKKLGELLYRLNQIDGVELPSDSLGRNPKILLSALTDEKALQQFLDTLGWYVEQIRAA